jgi:biopolymer transport protein ExbB
MWVILAFSVIAVAVGIERAAAQWRFMARARALADTVTRCLAKGAIDEARSACERSPSPLADVYLIGYEKLGRTSQENLAAAVHRERVRVGADLKSRLWVLGTIGATAPFVGLLGTTMGVVNAFTGMAVSGSGGLAAISKGIAEALVTTAFGLLVAIPAVWLYNYYLNRIDYLSMEVTYATKEFMDFLLRYEHELMRGEKTTPTMATRLS